MRICEIFYSIQGESTFAGLPCIFIRLTGCNLRCIYCDTTYSYEQGEEYSIPAIRKKIAVYPCKLVLITGGEPLLQDDVYQLIEHLNTEGYHILIETNGSISLKQIPSFVHKIIDVKLPGSGVGNSFLKENLQFLNHNTDELKFVISNRLDFDAAMSFIHDHKLYHSILLFSPVTEKLAPAKLADWIKETALPIRLNLQLHKIIWDKDTRSV